MKNIIYSFLEEKRLKKEEAKKFIINIANGNCNFFKVAFIIGQYKMRPPSLEELEGFQEALLDLCIKLYLTDFKAVDIVGTGGDYKNTFNISTISSFIVAGAGGKVIKHGNSNFSSLTGSATILKQLGYTFTKNESQLKNQLEKTGICFLHAPKFHPLLENISSLRKNIGLRTFFNMIGPILNTAQTKTQLIGVNELELAINYYYLFQKRKTNYTIIHSLDVYDEISLTGPFKCYSKTNGEQIIFPKNLKQIKIIKEYLICGKTNEENKLQFLNIISGNGSLYQNEIVLTNAALALKLLNGDNFETNYNRSKESLESGLAKKSLEYFLKI